MNVNRILANLSTINDELHGRSVAALLDNYSSTVTELKVKAELNGERVMFDKIAAMIIEEIQTTLG